MRTFTPPPPKFANLTTGQGPSTGDDWRQFIQWLNQFYSSSVQSASGTHALRSSASGYPVGALFYETDRQTLYQVQLVSGQNQWVFVAGVFSAPFLSRPVDLGTCDAGFHFYSTDYTVGEDWDGSNWIYRYGSTRGPNSILATLAAVLTGFERGWLAEDTDYGHAFYWTGSAWTFSAGEASQFAVNSFGTGPKGGPWYPCDGGAHVCENSDGTLSSVTTTNSPGWYLRA